MTTAFWTVTEISFMFVGNLRLVETRLYQRSKGKILSQHWLLFYALLHLFLSSRISFSLSLALQNLDLRGSRLTLGCTLKTVFSIPKHLPYKTDRTMLFECTDSVL